ncbi:MAG: hypothetical protein J5379_00525 [Clostridiales bacterium]|nr:hypothetical protein [Clostridiales bacterium]
MKLNELKSKAPTTGMLYLSTRRNVILRKYDDIDEEIKKLGEISNDEILEIHLFDRKTEYRLVQSAKKSEGLSTVVSDDSVKAKFGEYVVYEEEAFLEECFINGGVNKIIIVNYFVYDENDLLKVCNYRLKEV